MHRSTLVTALAIATPTILLLSACGDQPTPTETARVGASSAALSREGNGPEHAGALVAHDSCEPSSFNAGIAPGTCVKNGRTTLPTFIAQLQATGVARDWRFTPDEANALLGVDVLGNNVGGEEHTFTPVKQYGGGVVPLLNQLSGNPVPAPECLSLEADDRVASGGKYLIEAEELADVMDDNGIAHVQCCIHPWMRSEVRLKGGKGKG
jgi:hypothetical protein